MFRDNLTPVYFKIFRDLINEHSGMELADNKYDFLKIRLSRRAEKLKLATFKEYYHYLKYDSKGSDEIQALINAISINETHFFRDPNHFAVLNNHILPVLMEEERRRGGYRLRLWSAACATGEEAYSMAIVAKEIKKSQRVLWDIEITATDISTAALNSARCGVYDEYALRETIFAYVEKYFKPLGRERYQVKNELKKMVNFGWINLVDPVSTSKIGGMDCIFCRNVVMYLDLASRRRVMENMYRSLRPGGYLFLGRAESLREISNPFEIQRFNGTVIYRKKAVAGGFIKEAA